MKIKTEYVLGFCFLQHTSEVVLIQKNKPEWQRGLLNGIGGKIEPGEKPLDAMNREWYEETGAKRLAWNHFLTMEFEKSTVYVFKHHLIGRIGVSSITDEIVKIYNIREVLKNPILIPNLRWIILMAIEDSPTHTTRWKGAPTIKYP